MKRKDAIKKITETKIKTLNNYFRYLIKDSICFVQSPQPAGVWSNEFWDNLGKELKQIKK